MPDVARGYPVCHATTMSAAAPLPQGFSSQWEIDRADLELGEGLGTGSTSEVYRGSWHGTDVAAKVLLHQNMQQDARWASRFRRELDVLLELRHPNLVLFMGATTLSRPLTMVSELCEGGTLFQLLHNQPSLRLSWAQRLKAVVDTAKGMNFLHRRRVVHRDLKSLNLLLASKVSSSEDLPWVKISDFGLSRHLPAHAQVAADASGGGVVGSRCSFPAEFCASMMTGGLGTCLWMAPEVLSGSICYNEKVDVYSYGIVLFEILCRRVPFDGSGLQEPIAVAVAVSAGRRPDTRCVPADCPLELRKAMECCWVQEPERRPPFDQILEKLKNVRCLS